MIPKDEKIRNIEKHFQELLGSIMGFPHGFKKYKQMICIIFKLALVTEGSIFSHLTSLKLKSRVCDFIDKTANGPF